MGRLKLNNLARLHRSMKSENITQQKFNYKIDKRADFDVLFSIRSEPYVLALTERRASFFLKLDIHPGYLVDSIFDRNIFYSLIRLLKINNDSIRNFKPREFLQELDLKIPAVAKEGAVPTPREVAVIRKDLSESDKPFFLTWRRNDLRQAHVTKENLEKTREILGIKAAEFSKSQNLSSCWTADPDKDCSWKQKI